MPSLMRSINVISRCSTIYKSEKLEGELLGCHHPFVFCVCKNPGMSQDEIAHALCLNKSTVARGLSYLEEHGFVERKSDSADRRILRVYPTEAMLEALPRVRKIAKEWNERISEDISPEQFYTFISVLEKIEKRSREIVFGGDKD